MAGVTLVQVAAAVDGDAAAQLHVLAASVSPTNSSTLGSSPATALSTRVRLRPLAVGAGAVGSAVTYDSAETLSVSDLAAPLVVSRGTQQTESVVVAETGGHAGRLHLSLSTRPRGVNQEH